MNIFSWLTQLHSKFKLTALKARINQLIQKYFGSNDYDDEKEPKLISNFIWIFTRMYINYTCYILIASNTKWNYKTQQFEISNKRNIICQILALSQVFVCFLVLGYLFICVEFDLGDLEFVLSIAFFFCQALLTSNLVHRAQNPALTMNILNSTQQLNAKSGEFNFNAH